MKVAEPTTEPKLDKPGAGLPFPELFVAKHLLLPYKFQTISDEKGLAYFKMQKEQMVRIASNLQLEQLVERRLVPRLAGMEDSSRFWSVAMTLQHLNIVNGGIRQVISELSAGRTIARKSSTADVKPNANAGAEGAIEAFSEACDKFLLDVGAANIGAFPNVTFAHPWFGELKAHKWLVVAGTHMRIHHQQINEIISRI